MFPKASTFSGLRLFASFHFPWPDDCLPHTDHMIVTGDILQVFAAHVLLAFPRYLQLNPLSFCHWLIPHVPNSTSYPISWLKLDVYRYITSTVRKEWWMSAATQVPFSGSVVFRTPAREWPHWQWVFLSISNHAIKITLHWPAHKPIWPGSYRFIKLDVVIFAHLSSALHQQ